MNVKMDDALNISYYATDWRASTLSNITPTPLVFDGVNVACVESVIQSMNFPFSDRRHKQCLHLSGPECKSLMYDAELVMDETGMAWWDGMSFPLESSEREDILVRLLWSKFNSNKQAWEALRLCDGRSLGYVTSELDERLSFPSNLFLSTLSLILDDIREGSLPIPS